MGPEAATDLRQALHNPAVVHAMVEDYRAGLGVDREADEVDRGNGRKITCPILVVSALRDDPELRDDHVMIWRAWADDVHGRTIDCGHHMAEEAPDELAAILLDFLAT
jgi:haloacetate dehalogenase